MQAWVARIDSYDEAELGRFFEAQEAFLLAGLAAGDTVLVKPNLLREAPPERALTTDPRFVHAFVRFLLDRGCRVIVGDIPGNHIPAERLAAVLGLVEERNDPRLLICNLDQYGFQPVPSAPSCAGQTLLLPSLLSQCKVLFNLPKAKTHALTLVTGAVKNLFGLTSKVQRIAWHMIPAPEEFARCLLSLHSALPVPERVVMDGILGMEGDGPSAGRARPLGMVLLSDDPVLADWAMCRCMGLVWSRVPLARVTTEPDPAVVHGDLHAVRPAFRSPHTYVGGGRTIVALSAVFQRVAGARPLPVVRTARCVRCGICAQRCPAGAITLAPWPVFDRQRCVLCYCCQEMCPQRAIVLHRFPCGGCILKGG